jgi:hypothetical protein
MLDKVGVTVRATEIQFETVRYEVAMMMPLFAGPSIGVRTTFQYSISAMVDKEELS